jgi:peptide/nickel transport system permease protein
MTAQAASAQNKVVELLPAEAMPEEQTQFQVITRRFMRHKLAVLSLFLMVVVFTSSLFAKQIAPYGPTEIALGDVFATPLSTSTESGKIHYLGTDHLGRDYFSRILYAARISLSVSLTVVIGSVVVGSLFGAVSGFYGGVIDDVFMRAVEFLLTIPTLPILLIMSSILLQAPETIPIPEVVINLTADVMYIAPREAQQVLLVILVLMSFGWLGIARLMRGMVLSIKNQDFVEAARALGVSDLNIIVRHLIPNAFAPIIVSASLALAEYIILEAALSFIGFGIQDPTPTWGNMLAFTQSYMFQHPWLPLVPGLPIFICALTFNFVGDGLRDALDPRLKR